MRNERSYNKNRGGELSTPRTTEILEGIGGGWTSKLITAGGAETVAVIATPAMVGMLKVNGAYDVTIKDAAAAKWAIVNNATADFSNCPIKCATSVNLTFGGAGSAWIIYRELI